jgi:MFS transporter, DHA1 family, multidrug resistance protein
VSTSAPVEKPQLHPNEFIALIAMLFATVAFSIDSMLPALPEIAQELSPDSPNRAQMILTAFIFGMGSGTLFTGPLSDAFGRKSVIMAGSVLYCLGAALAFLAPTLETILLARLLQGLGAAAPRVVGLALVRDLYKGREMARVVSFAMMIFTLVPAVAPLIGTAIIAIGGWRGVFVAFLCFSIVSMVWLGGRQPETLPAAKRRPLNLGQLWNGMRDILGRRVVAMSILVQTMVYSCLFASISSIQPIFEQTFDRAESFPRWFALIALISGTSSLLNAKVVVRLGMRRMISTALGAQLAFSLVMTAAAALHLWPQTLEFAAYFLWTVSTFFMAGLTMGNLNALALEPVGHVAGLAASLVGAISTVGSVLIAAPIGLAFDGTTLPLMLGVTLCLLIGLVVMYRLPR